jgi:predicted nucleic acid-binding protein
MNGNSVLLDTNIVLYFLNGEETLIPILEQKSLFLSFITQIELLGSKNIEPVDHILIKSFIEECTVIDITPGIKETAIQMRKNYSLKLPDSIILATSLWLNMPLITADKDFKKVETADIIFFKR